METSLEQNTISIFQNMGREITQEIERFIRDGRSTIVLLANNPILQSNNVTVEEKHRQMMTTQVYHEIFDDITLLDTEGNVLTSTTYNYRGEWASNTWYQRALNGSVVVSDAHIILNPWKLVIVFLSPVYDNLDVLQGVVAGQLDLKMVWNIVDNIEIGNTGHVFLINNEGKLLSYHIKDKLFTIFPEQAIVSSIQQNQSGTAQYRTEDGTNLICSYMPLLGDIIYEDDGNWGLLLTQDQEEVLSSVHLFRYHILIFFLIISLIIILVSYLFSRNILRPITDLKNAAHRISAGDLNTHIDIRSHDEIGDLASTFKQMTKDLKYSRQQIEEHNKNLEHLVNVRTQELRTNVKELEKSKHIIQQRNLELQNNSQELVAMNQQLTAMNEELTAMQEELTALNANLEETVEKRTAEVQRLLVQKDQFINQLGHDLRTPLTPMMGLIPLIKDGLHAPQDKEMLQVLERNVHYMTDLVNETIQLAKLNSNKTEFQLENIQLSPEINTIIDNNKILVEKSNINIINNVQENILVKADKLRLQEVLNNLLVNAIKYMPENGGTISINAEKEKDEIILSMTDSGIGMTEEELDHIFEEFYKADSARHDLDSHGLGLAICKRIIELHGGRIWATSLGLGKGSTFSFTLQEGTAISSCRITLKSDTEEIR